MPERHRINNGFSYQQQFLVPTTVSRANNSFSYRQRFQRIDELLTDEAVKTPIDFCVN